MGVLDGIRVVEIAGIGPGPFCGMLLADMGAEVILVERADAKAGGMLDLGKSAIVNRGKRSLALNLKDPRAIDAVLRLIDGADALIEGMRPGVLERLGLGPEICLARNPRLVYGRMTGWGQDGPVSASCRARPQLHRTLRRAVVCRRSQVGRLWRRPRCWAIWAAARCIWQWASSQAF